METLKFLFPKVRIAVLRLLLLESSKEVHLREIARHAGISMGAVHRELANLVAAELVISRRDGNRQYFQANREHPIFGNLREIIEKCDRAADVLREALNIVPGIEIAFIFGSVAKRTDKARSDLDLMIIGTAGLRLLAGVLRPVAERLGREINPYVLTAQTWESKLNAKDTFITTVEGESKIFIKGDQNGLERLG